MKHEKRMGKVSKKVANPSDNQKKISCFFQNKDAVPKQSKLFSTVGPKASSSKKSLPIAKQTPETRSVDQFGVVMSSASNAATEHVQQSTTCESVTEEVSTHCAIQTYNAATEHVQQSTTCESVTEEVSTHCAIQTYNAATEHVQQSTTCGSVTEKVSTPSVVQCSLISSLRVNHDLCQAVQSSDFVGSLKKSMEGASEAVIPHPLMASLDQQNENMSIVDDDIAVIQETQYTTPVKDIEIVSFQSPYESSLAQRQLASESGDGFTSPDIIPCTPDAYCVRKTAIHGQTSKISEPDGNGTLSSPDVIPSTPNAFCGGAKRKNTSSRSFLSSTSMLGTRPGFKVTPRQLITANPFNQAKTSLVSISFTGSKNNVMSSDKSINKSDTDVFKSIIAKKQNCNLNRTIKSVLKMGKQNIDQEICEAVKERLISSNCGAQSEDGQDCVSSLHNKDNATQNTTMTEDLIKTPTKVYPDQENGISVKRLSKPGLSPNAKRLPSENKLESDDKAVSRSRSTSCRTNVNKAKRSLVLGVETCRKSQSKKVEAAVVRKNNNYQMNASWTEKNTKLNATISVNDDDLLGDIMSELHTESTQQANAICRSQRAWPCRSATIIPDTQMNGSLPRIENDSNDEIYFRELDSLIDNAEMKSQSQHDTKDLNLNDNAVASVTNVNKCQHKIKKTSSINKTRNVVENIILPKSDDGSINVVIDSRSSSKISWKFGSRVDSVNKPSHAADNCIPQKNVLSDVDQANDLNFSFDGDNLCQEMIGLSPFKETSKSSKEMPPCAMFGRHIVISVEYSQSSAVLTLESDPMKQRRRCVLHGFWLDVIIHPGDVVNVIGRFDDTDTCHISDDEGFLVIHPDLLISGTSVVSGVHCMRRSVLNEKFKGCDSKNIHMLYGSIIHCFFQEVLTRKKYREKDVEDIAQEVLRQNKFLHEMYSQSVNEDTVLEEIHKYIPQLHKWLDQYCSIGGNVLGALKSKDKNIQVTSIRDIEENIWSPRFGIKGKIDLTVDVRIKNKNGHVKKTVPLELKTGRATHSVEHKGQVTLYTMMSSDRREDPGEGLLLYLKEADMKVVPADHTNKRGLLQLRNEMAHFLSQKVEHLDQSNLPSSFRLGKLPEPINNQRSCSKCPQLQNCALYQKCFEDKTLSSTHCMTTLVPDTLSHLSEEHLEYFRQWLLMLSLEGNAGKSKKGLRDIWCLTGKEREKSGGCLSGMILVSSLSSQEYTERGQFVLKFQRQDGDQHSTPLLCDVGLNANDSVAISAENQTLIALCTGFITNIDHQIVTIISDRDFRKLSDLSSMIFRLDRCDNFNTTGTYFTNLSRLMANDAHCSRLREIIIDKRKPAFQSTLSKGAIDKVKGIFKPLNKRQKTAILKVLMATDYVLIKGYPGTGKTSTIVALVRVLHLLGYSVLLASYTHSAVDNILLKLIKDNIDFLRIGRLARIHPEVQRFSAELLSANIQSVPDMRQFYESKNIVATTCLGTTHPLFSQRRFDVCIVDEASQVLQPACLGPLFCAERFVLVGDPRQLPPVVQSSQARDLGLDESLFGRLDPVGATYELNLQYRMNSEVMAISNELVYNGALEGGSDEVLKATLTLPYYDQLTKTTEDNWKLDAISPDICRSTVFLDTRQVPAPEEHDQSGLVKNEVEAEIVVMLVQLFLLAGVDADGIGVIAPYRNQVRLVKTRLQGHDVEVNTVDQYQGRDKSIIIVTFVRSSTNDQSTAAGELLKDIRRLNVAVTRAKHKLILLGDVETLRHYEPIRKIILLLEKKQQIISLPHRAHLSSSR